LLPFAIDYQLPNSRELWISLSDGLHKPLIKKEHLEVPEETIVPLSGDSQIG
jgi:hypothetical protein